MNAFTPKTILLYGLFLIISTAGYAQAGEVTDLEEDLPVRLEDATPIGYLGRELQVVQHYEREHDNRDSFRTEARLEFGFPRNGQIKIGVPFLYGSAEDNGLGNISGEFLYNLNQETLWIPAFAVAAGAWLPTADETKGYDPVVKGIFTKTISGRTNTFQQLHANVGYRFNDDRTRDERDYELDLVFGYSRLLTSSLLFVSDFVRHWRMEDNVEENVVELGLRYQLTPLMTVSGATGFGFGDESPDVTLNVGLQLLF